MLKNFFKRALIIFFTLNFFLGIANSQANDSFQQPNQDPKNLFSLIEQTPLIIHGEIESVQTRQKGQSYFLYEIEIDKVSSNRLAGQKLKKGDNLWVLQEQIFPKGSPMLSEGQEGIFFLAELPKYSAYQQALQQGAKFRLLGGEKMAALALNQKDLASRVEGLLSVHSGGQVPELKRRALLMEWLKESNALLQGQAALALKEMKFSQGSLSVEEEVLLLKVLSQGTLEKKASLALVGTLSQSQSISTLQNVTQQTQGPAKWAAIRSLEKLGYPVSIQEITQGFSNANIQDKERILNLLIQKKRETAQNFLAQFFRSSENFELKRDALFEIKNQGGKKHEQFLIEQLSQLEPRVAAQVALVLGQMNSEASVPEMFKLLESDSEVLKDAAQASLRFNQSALAREYVKVNFVKDSHGHVHPKRHFSDIPGAAPRPHSHGSHQHSHDGHTHSH